MAVFLGFPWHGITITSGKHAENDGKTPFFIYKYM
jgi:hypothetical protein